MKHLMLFIALATNVYFSQSVAFSLKESNINVTPELELSDLNRRLHNLANYQGKVVMVQFWATYCPPCRKEMPSMNRLEKKLGSDKFKILAVNMGEDAEQVQKFANEVKPEFTILLDPDGKAIKAWKVYAAPATFIIDPDGKIRYTLFGGIEWDSDEIVTVLSKLLTKN